MNVAFSRNTKFTIANVALLPVGYLAYRYFKHVPSVSDETANVELGVALYLLIAVIVITRSYYRKTRGDVIGQTTTKSDALAYGMLGAARLKNINMELEVSPEELANFKDSGEILISPSRFNMPVRSGDMVELISGEGSFIQHSPAKIVRIDGVQQRVLLRKKK